RLSPTSTGSCSSTTTCLSSLPSKMERSAFGGSDLKLSFPSLQNGINAVVFMFPAIRSGRSVKKSVIGATPVNVSLFVALSNFIPFDVCTNRKSAIFDLASGVCAKADLAKASDEAASAALATNARRVVMSASIFQVHLHRYRDAAT